MGWPTRGRYYLNTLVISTDSGEEPWCCSAYFLSTACEVNNVTIGTQQRAARFPSARRFSDWTPGAYKFDVQSRVRVIICKLLNVSPFTMFKPTSRRSDEGVPSFLVQPKPKVVTLSLSMGTF